MKGRSALLIVCLAISCRTAFCKPKDDDLKAYLTQVTERARALYEYDQAAWHGTDAFLALHPDTEGLSKYVCQKTSHGWVVSFGKLGPARDKFIVVYEATETSHPGEFTAKKLDPPREDTGYQLIAEKAIQLASDTFQPENRQYNTAVLPAPDSNFYVYIYPGQTKSSVWPLGGDTRYTISADGTKIIEKRSLHKTILDREFPEGTVAGVHSHILSDVPEDTDVLFVLTRKPSIPEYVGANKKVFAIAADGSIAIVKN
jgi:hypothetical protein